MNTEIKDNINYEKAYELLVNRLVESSEKFAEMDDAYQIADCIRISGEICLKELEQPTTLDHTGLIIKEGTLSKAETIFNSTDSSKLYDLIKNGGSELHREIMDNIIKPMPKVEIIPSEPVININIGDIKIIGEDE